MYYTSDISGVNIGSTQLNGVFQAFTGFFATFGLIMGIVSLLTIIELWIIFKKCGKPGIASIVPIWNVWTLFEISGLGGWWCLLPVANIIFLLICCFKLPKRFGKSGAFGLGILFFAPIFFGILAFGKNKVVDGDAQTEQSQPAGPDLMAQDPNENGNINLMTPDPIATMPEVTPSPVNEMQEQPILTENQMNMSTETVTTTPVFVAPSEPVAPIPEMITPAPATEVLVQDAQTTTEAPIENNQEPSNAFNMPAPDITNQTINPEITNPSAEVTKNEMPLVDQTPEMVINDNDPFKPATSQDFEMPKMANDVVGSATQTKKCPNCGFENASSVRACLKCGQILE